MADPISCLHEHPAELFSSRGQEHPELGDTYNTVTHYCPECGSLMMDAGDGDEWLTPAEVRAFLEAHG